jgi:hypothetical protein
LVLLIDLQLMGFSLAAALLAQPALAAIAATGYVTLSSHLGRRLLS